MSKRPKDAKEYKKLMAKAGLYALGWMAHKTKWEQMSLMAVAYDWGIPSNAEAKEFGVTRRMAEDARQQYRGGKHKKKGKWS